MARTVGIGHQDFETVITKGIFYIDKTSFIKEWWENEDSVTLIAPPALWQDAEHEHGGEVLLHRFCGERGTVRRPCHLAGKIPGWGLQVQAPSGNLPCRQPFFCKGESGHVPGHQKADLPDHHGTVQ